MVFSVSISGYQTSVFTADFSTERKKRVLRMQQKNNKAYMYSMKAACGQKRQSVLDPVFRMWDVSRFKSRLCNMLLPWTNLTLNSGVRVSHCASVISSEVFHAAEQEANEANFFRGWVTLPPKLAAIWNDTKKCIRAVNCVQPSKSILRNVLVKICHSYFADLLHGRHSFKPILWINN